MNIAIFTDYFGMIDKNDRFRITLEKSNDSEIGIINQCLKDLDFLFMSKDMKVKEFII